MKKINGFFALRICLSLFAVLALLCIVLAQYVDPDPTDTDGDGMTDGWETYYGFNPLLNEADGIHGPMDDPDSDNLLNCDESYWSTNPFAEDTDLDGFADVWEVFNRGFGFSPTVDDSYGDADMDMLSNAEEKQVHLTDPLNADTDTATYNDYDEIYVFNTAPLVWTGDPGGMGNGLDSDLDGLSDDEEYYMWYSDPWDWDTDDDTMSDGDEVNIYGTSPTVWDECWGGSGGGGGA